MLRKTEPRQTIYKLHIGGTGGTPAIHWFAILKKILIEQSATLDKAALAYCKVGIGQYDGSVVSFKAKYTYNLLRPVTYIRNVLGHSTWLPFSTPGLPTPIGRMAPSQTILPAPGQ